MDTKIRRLILRVLLLVISLFLLEFEPDGTLMSAADARANTLLPAQEANLVQKLAAPDGELWDLFGYDVALDGNTALIGAPEDDTSAGEDAGTAYVFTFSEGGWKLQAALHPTNATAFDRFGHAVALMGDIALVAAPNASTTVENNGVVYVFKRSDNNWSVTQKITASTVWEEARFGNELALDRSSATLLIGEYGIYDSYVGRVFSYKYNGDKWNLTDQLEPLPVEYHSMPSWFGHSLAINGDTAIVGAPSQTVYLDSATGFKIYRGAVHIYKRDDTHWKPQTYLLGDGEPNQYEAFGTAVTLGTNMALISAPGATVNGIRNSGTVYHFMPQGESWVLQSKFSPEANENSRFGQELALHAAGNLAIISEDWGQPVYLYRYTGSDWNQLNRWTVSEPGYTGFGYSVDIDNETALIGAIEGDGAEEDTGTAYIYQNITVPVNDNLLVNGSFEIDANNDFVPDGWTRKDTLVDARRCNQPGKPPVAYDGNCAYMFKGGVNSEARLFQTVSLNGYALKPGDKIKLTGFYHKQSAGTVYVRLFVNYATLPEDQGMVSMTKKTDGYQPIPALVKRLQSVPTRIHVLIQNKTTSGKTYVDGMSLKWVSKSGSGVIPLPPSADNPVPLPVAP